MQSPVLEVGIIMALRHLKRIFVSFSPGDPRASSAREFLQRITGEKARKSNPGCAVDFSIEEDAKTHGLASVALTFADGTQMKVRAADYPVDELARLIDNKGQEIELQNVLGEVKGYNPWAEANRLGPPASK